ncbi:MAG TPA: YaaR family protein [Firmicutes bacterium]|nr:YaaR family protein [Bacillota bacterium]
MRIKGIGTESSPPLPERGELIPEHEGKVAFKQILRTAGEQEATGWDQLLNRVDEAAKKLVNQPSMATLRSYRAAVRDFMKKAISGSYQMKGESRWDRRGNRRVFCVVQKINQALEELTTAVLEKNAETITLMAKIDEIRGLLIDLYY